LKKYDFIKTESGDVFRILSIESDQVLAINCQKKMMPKYYFLDFFSNAEIIENVLPTLPNMEELSPLERKTAHERFTLIAAPLAYISEPHKRSSLIAETSSQFGISKQSIRSFLCTYLIYQDIAALAPRRQKEKELTDDQKNMRWALNKFFYTRNQNSLSTAYAMMLKAKYCDTNGKILSEYPSFNQFRYFYRKTRKLESFYISRNGIKEYQRNRRPLLGDGVQEFAPCIGTSMLDSTICDIHLVNESGQLIGRPILVAACDANTSLCLGYSLLWEAGTYSLQNLMLNIIENKTELCKKMGIQITPEQWPSNSLPGIIITDGGPEYKGHTFEQVSELGITLINLPSFRPELKGPIEKLFNLVQESYKNCLKGKGVIMPDYQERGAHDYRKDALLTLKEFEKIVVKCIIHYNCQRVLQNYPYTQEMLDSSVLPFANAIWNWKSEHDEIVNLISVSKRELVITLLPRAKGKFTRYGLKVNKLRYYADGYKEQFLQGGTVIVSYNPDNCNKVWLHERNGDYIEFSLIESRFNDMSLKAVQELQQKQSQLIQDSTVDTYKSKIELISFIETIANKNIPSADISIKDSVNARKSARKKHHKNIGGILDD